MKWYMCWASGSRFRTDHDWENLIRTALYSARVNTRLEPVIVIDGEPDDFTAGLEAAGARLIFHRVSFHDALARHYPDSGPNLAVYAGAFLRFDIPLIEREAEYALYTDCDVAFLRHPEFLPEELPHYFAAAPEQKREDPADLNSGVMLMNLRNMRAVHEQLVAFTVANLHLGLDQEILKAVFAGRFTPLRPELNWKPYWGLNPGAAILHWHGPKPATLRHYLADEDFSSHEPWNHLFHANPESYRLHQRLHEDLRLGAEAARRQEARFLRILAPEAEPFWGEYIAHLRVLNEIMRRSGLPRDTSLFFEAEAPAPAPEARLADARRNFAAFANFGASLLQLGFNAGHGALLALLANPALSYLAIDDLAQPCSRPCFDYLRQVFGQRIRLLAGPLEPVLAQFPEQARFDLVAIGGQDFALAAIAFREIPRIAAPGSLLLAEHGALAPVRAAALAAIAAGRVKPANLPMLATPQLFLEVAKA